MSDVVEQAQRLVAIDRCEVRIDRPAHDVATQRCDACQPVQRPLVQPDALQAGERQDRELAPHDPAPQQQHAWTFYVRAPGGFMVEVMA